MPATDTAQRNSSKYLPCLLTRLTDEHPFSTSDTEYGASFLPEQLKKDILTNLTMLLNSHTAPAETRRLRALYPLVAASGYHFGIDSSTGLTASAERPEIIAASVRRALREFEPRLAPESIQVSVDTDIAAAHDRTSVHLTISSRLAVKPLTEDMVFRLRVDVETGEMSLTP